MQGMEARLDVRWGELEVFVISDTLPSVTSVMYERIARGLMGTTEARDARVGAQEDVRAKCWRMREYFDILQNCSVERGCHTALFLYCREVWIAEQNVPDDAGTSDAVEAAIEAMVNGAAVGDVVVSLVDRGLDIKSARKVCGIVSTALHIFVGDGVVAGAVAIDMPFVFMVHQKLMADLLPPDQIGVLRTTNLGSRCGRRYIAYEQVQNRLAALLAFVKAKRADIAEDTDLTTDFDRFYKLLVLGAFMLLEFLTIHPFVNGNGRTVRMLIATLLADCVAVPMSLFRAGDGVSTNREAQLNLYIDALEKSRSGPPLAVVRWVIDCTVSHLFELGDLM